MPRHASGGPTVARARVVARPPRARPLHAAVAPDQFTDVPEAVAALLKERAAPAKTACRLCKGDAVDGSKLERGPIVLDKTDDGDEKTIDSID